MSYGIVAAQGAENHGDSRGIYMYIYSNLICLLFVNVRKYITTRHLNLSYISILTNLL